VRGNQTSHNRFEIRGLDLTPLDEVIRPMLDQNDPTKGGSQEDNKPGQKAKDRGEHATNHQHSPGKGKLELGW
jgi:hypothetical protein